jgi:hypothetical protein
VDERSKKMILDWRGHLITPEEMLEMAKTEEGKKKLFDYILKGRIAMGMMNVFRNLEIVPEMEKQFAACEIIYECLTRVPIGEVMEFAKDAATFLEKDENEIVGNC